MEVFLVRVDDEEKKALSFTRTLGSPNIVINQLIDDHKKTLSILFATCYEKMFGIWGTDLIGIMYRKVDWMKDTEYNSMRRGVLFRKFKRWLTRNKLTRVGNKLYIFVLASDLQFALDILRTIREYTMRFETQGLVFTAVSRSEYPPDAIPTPADIRKLYDH